MNIAPDAGSCRAMNLTLQPQAHQQHGLQLEVYTYGYSDVQYACMRETVYFAAKCGPVRFGANLTPDEARVLANQLLQVADQADEHKARRTSLEDIEDQLRDPEFDSTLVRFCHPDVVYAAPGRMQETIAAHPGKLVIGLPADDSGLDEAPAAAPTEPAEVPA